MWPFRARLYVPTIGDFSAVQIWADSVPHKSSSNETTYPSSVTNIPYVYTCKKITDAVKDPVVHVWWSSVNYQNTKTPSMHCREARFCRSWLFKRKMTRISSGINPNGTMQLLKKKGGGERKKERNKKNLLGHFRFFTGDKWLVCRVAKRWTELCFQHWWMTGHKLAN